MVEPTPITTTTAPDADTIYIINRLTQAAEEDRLAGKSTERAREHRIEAGKRLIEVRARLFSEKGLSGNSKHSPKPGWLAQLRNIVMPEHPNGMPIATAYRLMKLAGYTKEQRVMHRTQERNRKRAERGPKSFRMGWLKLLMDAGVGYVKASGEGLAGLRAEIKEKLGTEPPKYFTDRAEAQAFVDKVRLFRAPLPKSEEFTEPQQKKIDRIIAAKLAELQASYEKTVSEEVEKRMPEASAYTEKVRLEYLEELNKYKALNFNFKKQISADEYRLLIQLLHPDKAPPGREKQYTEAFQIVRRLQAYAEA